MKLKIAPFAAALAVAFALPASVPAFAATPSEALSQCLLNKTSADDRTTLVRWIFAVIARHPSVADMGTISDAAYETASAEAGVLFTRLMAEDCRTETKAAMATGSSTAIGTGFEALGRTAGTDLMTHPSVQASMADLIKYVDLNKIAQVMYGN